MEEILVFFSTVWPKKVTNELIEAYCIPLQRFADEEVRRAGHKLLESEYFPKPHNFVTEINRNKPPDDGYISNFDIKSGRKCAICGRVRVCIDEPKGSEYQCRECYTGMTSEEIEAKIKGIAALLANLSLQRKTGYQKEMATRAKLHEQRQQIWQNAD